MSKKHVPTREMGGLVEVSADKCGGGAQSLSLVRVESCFRVWAKALRLFGTIIGGGIDVQNARADS